MNGRDHRYQARDRLRQLRAFVGAAELRSISRAADTLALAPPAAALLVRELEHELAATLFERGMHDVTLTPAGECLYGLVSPLLEALGTLVGRLEGRDVASAPPRLRIVTEGGAPVRIASRILKRIFDEDPEFDLQVRTGSRDDALRGLLADEASLAFGEAVRGAEGVPDDLVFRPLLLSRWVMIAPPGHPLAERETVTLDEIGQWPTIAPTPKYLSQEPETVEAPYRHPGFRRGVALESEGLSTAYALVEAGVGITVVGALALPGDARFASVPVADHLPVRTFGLFHRSRGPVPALLRIFVEAAQAEYPDASSRRDAVMDRRPDPPAGEEESHRGATPAKDPFETDLRRLRAFCFAVKYRSISRAAEAVLINQPTASKWIRQLEAELGAVLLDRSTAGVAPTAAAERLYRQSAPLVRALDRLPEAFAERFRGEMVDRLRIGAGQTSAVALLPRYLERFQDSCPGVEVIVKVGNGPQRQEWLRHFDVDLVIGSAELDEAEFERHHLTSSEIVLITPEDHPLAGRESVDLAEVAAFPAVAPPRDHYIGQLADMVFRQRGLIIDRALEVSGWNVMQRYVKAGVGITMVPDICVSDRDRVRKIPASDAFPARDYSIFVRKDSTLPLAAERFLGIVKRDTAQEG